MPEVHEGHLWPISSKKIAHPCLLSNANNDFLLIIGASFSVQLH